MLKWLMRGDGAAQRQIRSRRIAMTVRSLTARSSRFSALLLLAGLVAAASVPFDAAQAQQNNNNFFGNLFKPPGQVKQGGSAPAGDETAIDPGEATVRIDRLENQIRQMTGNIEQLQYRNQQLEAQVKRLQDELNYTTGAGGAPVAGAPSPGTSAAMGAPAGVPPVAGAAPAGRRPDVFDPATQPGAPGAPRPLGTTQPSAPVAGAQAGAPMDLGAMSGAAAAAGGPVAALPPANTPKDQFDQAYAAMLRQDYQQSAQGFRQFIQQYPNDRATPDAYYWLGESEYLRKSYKEAAQNFLKVSADYPNAVKAPDAMLRLGQSLAAIGEKDAACATFNAVGNKYPRATTTIKQGVEREQKRAGC